MKTTAAKLKAPKMQKYTIKDFQAEFPNDDACLEWLKNYLYPNGIHCQTCDRVTKHHKVASRKSYSCDYCGHHVHPTADTIYHKSSTPLTIWFYAIYLMASTRCGISAKQIQRETGVTYKTAWRMFNQIRKMLAEDVDPLSGKVEIDETFVGGRYRHPRRGEKRGRVPNDNKITVAGAVERGGKVIARVVPERKGRTLMPFVRENVREESTVYTDEWNGYWPVSRNNYTHHTIQHKAKIWAQGDTHTNSVEGFWSLVKGGIRGVYHGVSPKYLQNYLDEFSFRYNRRFDETPMFRSFLTQVRKVSSD
ncbi:MAG TPA: IS1595 family transposase [Pyrinomonadaceae bacterium]|nr:IS1595 family transposase [Pyrinomonadaceae bacterium]